MAKTLSRADRPTVAVETAVLTVRPDDDALCVLQVRRDGERGWALPGTILRAGERLVDAVLRSLREKAGIDGAVPRQLHVVDEPGRDDRGWVLSVAHVMVVAPAVFDARLPSTRVVPADAPGRLPIGQGSIVTSAVADTRRRYAERPDPDGLLGDEFTIFDLRRVHAAVAGGEPQKDTFRRAMEPQLAGTGAALTGARGRPAELFRRRPTPRG